MTYREWANKYPEAAKDLIAVTAPAATVPPSRAARGEGEAQQNARLSIADQGAYSWRNNVGATPAVEQHTCPKCRFTFRIKKQPVRYGLANESEKINKRVKSSDLILAIPRVIRPIDVGTTIAQFGAVEVKAPGVKVNGKGREGPQNAWISLINRIGGYACFSNGDVQL